MIEETCRYFHQAADTIGLADKVRDILLSPRRTVKVEVAGASRLPRKPSSGLSGPPDVDAVEGLRHSGVRLDRNVHVEAEILENLDVVEVG